MSLMYVTSDC